MVKMRWFSSRKSRDFSFLNRLCFVLRPIDNVVHFGDSNEKRVLSFGTRQMIFKELIKERVKRNVRSKSDKHEMPMAVQRAPTESQPFVSSRFSMMKFFV